jgi:hypothetical protein
MPQRRILDDLVKIPGRLMADILSDGTVSILFLARVGGGNASPITVKDLNAAEKIFIACGLTAELSAAVRSELTRNNFASVDTSIDEAMASKFQYRVPYS